MKMTVSKIKELANRNPHNVPTTIILEKENASMENNTVKQPTRILEISQAFIKDFCEKASKKDCEWVTTTTAYFMDKYEGGKYFPPFRTEFARKFLPHLTAKKVKANRASFLEELYAIEQSKSA